MQQGPESLILPHVWTQYAVKVRRHRWSVVVDPRNAVHAL